MSRALTAMCSTVRRNASINHITVPRVPGFGMSFAFDRGDLLRPLDVYFTAIQLMYELAQRNWDESIFALIEKYIEGYNVLFLFINHQPPGATNQLKVQHCVAALFRAVLTMTEQVMFCQLRCRLTLRTHEIGGLSVAPVDYAATANTSVDLHGDPDGPGTNTSNSTLWLDHGQIVDPDDFLFVIDFHWHSKSIKSTEVSLAILDALATAAPFDRNDECVELEALSPQGDCVIFIDGDVARKKLTYAFATRALKLMYSDLIVRQKRFGDLYLELQYNERKFGEIRILKIVSAQNGTGVAADA